MAQPPTRGFGHDPDERLAEPVPAGPRGEQSWLSERSWPSIILLGLLLGGLGATLILLPVLALWGWG